MMQEKRKKRIAIVTPYGAEPRLENYPEFVLAQALLKSGWDVRMYTYATKTIPTYQKNFIYKGIPVYRCRERYGISPWLFFSLLSFRPDTVSCFHPRSLLNFSAYIAGRLVRARIIVEIIGILHDPYIVNNVDDPEDNIRDPLVLVTKFSQLLPLALKENCAGLWRNYVMHMPTANADVIVAVNKNEISYIRSIYGRDAVLIYPSVLQQGMEIQKKPTAENLEPSLPAEFLFFIGQIKRRKGWDTVIDAIAILAKKGIVKHLAFVTPINDLSEPIKYTKERGVRDQITFFVGVSNEEKNWLYAHCTYVLIPSRYEGFGLPVFEAFWAEKPVCATRIATFNEFLEDRKNAMLGAVGSGEDLAHSVEELDNDPELQNTLIANGLKTAKEFSPERMVGEYLKLLS